jgi:manganese-transporting P-type ATPase
MSIKPYPIYVYRLGSWKEIQTDELVPGDICSILRSKEDSPVPADLLVVDGSCIANEAMLSGESTPQLKESARTRDHGDIFDVDVDKNNMLFGGTKILQVTSPEESAALTAPDHGCIAYVLRTGFSTQQGALVRTIIYSTERVTANNLESLLFILFLLIFAFAAAAYVWIEGTKNEERKRSKVLLDCILIITSVVPPELPMELSLAVNNSILALAKEYVFCTEPFRIPFAGKVEIACFDKTGTLTEENLLVEGISGLGNDAYSLSKTTQAPKQTTLVLAAAHALVELDDNVIGDPMEKNTLDSIEWTVGKSDIISPKGKDSKTFHKILRRFPFSSALKRMSTISSLTDSGKVQLMVSVKGAPETLKSMYTNVPKDYDKIYKHWARRGSRVLSLGYKVLDNSRLKEVSNKNRDLCSMLSFYIHVRFEI